MKVVHINTNDSGGGAAIACSRHCAAMNTMGHESVMIVARKQTDFRYVRKYTGVFSFYILNRLLNRVITWYVQRLNAIGKFSYFFPGINFMGCTDIKDADVIVVHWINNGIMSLSGLESILKLGKPTYWYMHDMFPITGGCHHSLGCAGFMSSCSDCKIVQNRNIYNFADFQLRQKIRCLSKYDNLIFGAPSVWLTELSRKSALAKKHTVVNIPNVIDTKLYKPTESTKNKYGLDGSKYTILIGNASIQSPYKGMQYAYDLLKALNPDKYEALIIGGSLNPIELGIKINVISVGFVSDEKKMIEIYNACDLFVITSVAENYPNVVLEAMACGKPCVGFPTGGIPDLIKHKITGYLTKKYNAQSLIEGVEWCVQDCNYSNLSNNARRQIVIENDFTKVMKLYGLS